MQSKVWLRFRISSLTRILTACLVLVIHTNSFSLPPSFNGGKFGGANDNEDNSENEFPATFLFSSTAASVLSVSTLASSNANANANANANVNSPTPPTPSAEQITKKTGNLLQSTLKFWRTKFSSAVNKLRRTEKGKKSKGNFPIPFLNICSSKM